MNDNKIKALSDTHDEMRHLFEMHGIDADQVSFVEPVAAGSQTLEQNREMLLAMLEQLES